MQALAKKRLAQERKNFRKTKPYGFFARPEKLPDGSQNLFKWKCGFPGKKGTPWEGGIYKLTLEFPSDFPKNPPKAKFDPVIFHPNVFDDGSVCLTILKPDKGWAASLDVVQVLKGIHDLLTDPNENDPANSIAGDLYTRNRTGYDNKIRIQAAAMSS
uniref:UBC core domain-containing protein n=1 Tax=Lotharella oceanica TaxID=641309 RepID=A0A7S2TQV0_9EUKA|mmetsp:Transcript_22910/g.43039  ORF Transcript_22910/g.43039 Transcript_22910/m.43039 type:complete len:158 (+) Transcript_22910:52-525(+)